MTVADGRAYAKGVDSAGLEQIWAWKYNCGLLGLQEWEWTECSLFELLLWPKKPKSIYKKFTFTHRPHMAQVLVVAHCIASSGVFKRPPLASMLALGSAGDLEFGNLWGIMGCLPQSCGDHLG